MVTGIQKQDVKAQNQTSANSFLLAMATQALQTGSESCSWSLLLCVTIPRDEAAPKLKPLLLKIKANSKFKPLSSPLGPLPKSIPANLSVCTKASAASYK